MRIATVALGAAMLAACAPSNPPSTQIVVLGESFAAGSEAVNEVNLAIANASAAGCEAVSVGGYAAGGEGLIIGVPVLLDCPLGTQLLPTGQPVP